MRKRDEERVASLIQVESMNWEERVNKWRSPLIPIYSSGPIRCDSGDAGLSKPAQARVEDIQSQTGQSVWEYHVGFEDERKVTSGWVTVQPGGSKFNLKL